jgi:hypothetical protein
VNRKFEKYRDKLPFKCQVKAMDFQADDCFLASRFFSGKADF